jgi:hypothetical protein
MDFTLLEKSDVEFTEFTGSFLDAFFGFNYIAQRNKNACFVFGGKKVLPIWDSNLGLIWECTLNRTRILYYPYNFLKNFKKCKERKNIRFIFIHLLIHSTISCSDGIDWGSHANVLIYDKKTNTFYRFEPHGCRWQDTNYDAIKLDEELTNFLKTQYKAEYKSPKQCCPQYGIQIIEQLRGKKLEGDPGGFCLGWTLWMVEFRLKHPDIPFKDLQYEAIRRLDDDKQDVTKLIRNFSQELVEKRKEIIKQLPDKIIESIKKYNGFDKLNKKQLKLVNDVLQREFTEIITRIK